MDNVGPTDNQKELEEDKVEFVKLKCEEYLNGWKRAKADFINYQKDEDKRFEQVLKFSNENIVRDLLMVLDSFSLAAEALTKEASSPVYKALFLIQSQLEDLLKRNGLEKLKVSLGDVFDPSVHESVAEVDWPVEGQPFDVAQDKLSNTIAEEVEKGYTLHGKVVRPARVKVFK